MTWRTLRRKGKHNMPAPSPDMAQAAEAMGRAKLDKRAAGAMNPVVEDVRNRLVEGAEKARKEAKPPISAFEAVQRELDVVEHDASQKTIEKTFDTGLDKNIGDPPALSTGTDRKLNAELSRDLMEGYLKKDGYDALPPADKDIIRGQIADVIKSEVWGTDMLDDVEASGVTPADKKVLRDEFLDMWAKDDDFRQYAREIGKGALANPPEDAKTYQATIDAKQKQQDDLILTGAEIGEKIDKNTEDQQAAAAKLDEFLTGKKDPGTGAVIGEIKNDKLTALQTEIDAEKKDYEAGLAELDVLTKQAEKQEELRKAGKLSFRDKIKANLSGSDQAGKDMLAIQTKLRAHEGKVQNHADLVGELDGIIASQTTLKDQEFQFSQQLSDATTRYHEVGTEIDLAEIARAETEAGYADSLKNVFKTAMERRMLEEQVYQDKAAATALTEAAPAPISSDKPLEKSIKAAEGSYWGTVDIKNGKPDLSGIDKVKVADSLARLTEDPVDIAVGIINPATRTWYTPTEIAAMPPADVLAKFGNRGPEAVMTHILQTQINPATNAAWTLGEIADGLAADPDLFKRNEESVVKTLLKKSFATKQVDVNALQAIVNNPSWGGETLVNNIMEDPDVKKALKGHGLTLDKEFLKERKNWLWLVALFFTTGPLGVAIFVGMKGLKKE